MSDDPLNPDGDPFGPPKISTWVHCIHCNEEYDSYRIEWRIETCQDGVERGFWCCPMPGCDGRGFCFDIFPTDPEWRDEHGESVWVDGEEEDLDDADLDDAMPDDALHPNGQAGKPQKPDDLDIPF